LIRHGAKINLADKEGNTALTLAADNGLKSEIVKALINAGAEINVKNGEGRSALMSAANSDNVESVRILLLAGARVDLKDSDGETAVTLASDDDVKRLLMEYGAEIDPEDMPSAPEPEDE
ncbi:MAG: ankyrin repeat domain-containing protein, partial [Pyrinomonadaceae bacterium]